ncbi:unnamed protein product, partial [Iphiclides podalirius]
MTGGLCDARAAPVIQRQRPSTRSESRRGRPSELLIAANVSVALFFVTVNKINGQRIDEAPRGLGESLAKDDSGNCVSPMAFPDVFGEGTLEKPNNCNKTSRPFREPARKIWKHLLVPNYRVPISARCDCLPPFCTLMPITLRTPRGEIAAVGVASSGCSRGIRQMSGHACLPPYANRGRGILFIPHGSAT